MASTQQQKQSTLITISIIIMAITIGAAEK